MKTISLAPRELEIMSVLWQHGSATVADVRDDLDDDLAYTSVLSALQALEQKGYVRHEAEGRVYRYIATIDADEVGDGAIARIRDSIFQGSAERMFAQFVGDRKLTRKQLEAMRKLLAERLKKM